MEKNDPANAAAKPAKRKKPSRKPKKKEDATIGRPTKYRPEYCDQLVAHMEKGGSFESFSALVGTHRDTLYAWSKDYKAFSDAHKKGNEVSLKFYEDLGLRGATGQLRRVVSETPVLHPVTHEPVIGPDGKVLTKKEYAPAQFSAGTWCFMMKNRHRWRDRVETITDPDGGQRKPYASASEAELDQRMQEHLADLQMSLPSKKGAA